MATVLRTAPAARCARRHRLNVLALRTNLPIGSRRSQTTNPLSVQESLRTEPPATETPSPVDIAAAAVEACARALEAWAELSQRADLLHNAAATLRRASGPIAAEAMKPAG